MDGADVLSDGVAVITLLRSSFRNSPFDIGTLGISPIGEACSLTGEATLQMKPMPHQEVRTVPMCQSALPR